MLILRRKVTDDGFMMKKTVVVLLQNERKNTKGKSIVSMIMPFQGAEVGDVIESQGVTLGCKIKGFQP